MLKVAIVGCGKIADSHAAQITRIKGCEIVGVCDQEPLMAQQLCDRFPVKRWFGNLSDMLDKALPDVVHVTTPPQSHFPIATRCLEAGCHVYVEKPFTLYPDQARRLIASASDRRLHLTVGHDDQFSPVAQRMRTLVRSGFLGDGPLHMESYYCYELGRSPYVRALLGDKQHWVRSLPGKLLQNIISHGIARIAEFLSGESPQVLAHGFRSAFLTGMGEHELIDELRVVICEGDSATAYFTFSSQMHPSLHQFRMYGSRNGLILDQDQETLFRLRGRRYKSYLEKFIPPLAVAKQGFGNASTNIGAFVAGDLHMKSGMKFLIESFYRSIREGAPLPITYREILATSNIMEAIFQQLPSQGQHSSVSQQARMATALVS